MRLVLVCVAVFAIACAVADARSSKLLSAFKNGQKATQTFKFGGVEVTQAQIDAFTAKLKPATTADMWLIHYSDFSTCVRWHIQGTVTAGEMAFFCRPEAEGSSAVYGAGMYMANHPTSSESYGPCATEFFIPKGTLLWDWSVAIQIFGSKVQKTNLRFKVELGAVVPFIDYVRTDLKWYVAHHKDLVKKVRINWPQTVRRLKGPNVYGLMSAITFTLKKDVQNLYNNQTPDWRVKKFQNSWDYFTSLYNLMFYLDPISFLRAVRVMPGDPWQAFEPQYFGKFKETRVAFMERIWLDNAKFSVTEYTMGKDGFTTTGCTWGVKAMKAGDWADQMIDKVISAMPKAFAGADMKFRNRFVRAGGDEPGRTFYAAGYQVKNMLANPYLITGATTVKGPGLNKEPLVKGDYYACYFYPDLENLAPGISGLISKAGANLDALKAAKDYNGFYRALLKGVLMNLYGKPYTTSTATDALIDLISIHPFANFNGRTVRLFVQLAAMECRLPVPIPAVGDMDTVESRSAFASHIDLTVKAYDTIVGGMLGVFMVETANIADQNPQNHPKNDAYLKGEIKYEAILDSLGAFGMNVPAKLTDAQYNMIEKRKWNPLFDSIGGGTWVRNRSQPAGDRVPLPFDDKGLKYDVNEKNELVPADPNVKVPDLKWQA